MDILVLVQVFFLFFFSQELHNLRNALVVWYYGSRV